MDPQLSAFFDEMHKIAEEPYEHPAMTVLKGIGGFSLGAGLGYVGTHLADRALRYATGGQGLHPAFTSYIGPAAGSVAGMGFAVLQSKMMDRIKSNTSEKPNVPQGPPA